MPHRTPFILFLPLGVCSPPSPTLPSLSTLSSKQGWWRESVAWRPAGWCSTRVAGVYGAHPPTIHPFPSSPCAHPSSLPLNAGLPTGVVEGECGNQLGGGGHVLWARMAHTHPPFILFLPLPVRTLPPFLSMPACQQGWWRESVATSWVVEDTCCGRVWRTPTHHSSFSLPSLCTPFLPSSFPLFLPPSQHHAANRGGGGRVWQRAGWWSTRVASPPACLITPHVMPQHTSHMPSLLHPLPPPRASLPPLSSSLPSGASHPHTMSCHVMHLPRASHLLVATLHYVAAAAGR
ncbi:unnamed protein product [Closterium sp. Naga37s-1]|nr:unnamed protein product [Closterium sp. Naga37s-1]